MPVLWVTLEKLENWMHGSTLSLLWRKLTAGVFHPLVLYWVAGRSYGFYQMNLSELPDLDGRIQSSGKPAQRNWALCVWINSFLPLEEIECWGISPEWYFSMLGVGILVVLWISLLSTLSLVSFIPGVQEPFNLFPDFSQREFIHKLLLNKCVCGGNQGPGIPFHHLADVISYIISFYSKLARLIFNLDFGNTLENIFCYSGKDWGIWAG